jgi:SEC-C motif-containing protein
MNPGPRKVLLFGLGFAPLFVFFLWLYPRILAPYERLVLAVANPFLSLSSPPLWIDVNARGDIQAFATVSPGETQSVFGEDYAPHVIYLNLVFLPALVLATPVPLKRRGLNLILGLSLIFLLHVITLIVLLKSYICLAQDAADFSCFCLHGVALTSGQVMGVAVWALISWSCWFPRQTGGLPVPDNARPGRNSICFCGSGRKFKFCCGQ